MRYYDLEQLSPEWFNMRIGKLTGSNFGRIVKANWMELVDQIVAEQLTGYKEQNMFETEDTIRGKNLEPIALELYSKIKGVEIIKCGFIQSPDFEWAGSSPDGILLDGSGIIEVKSPKVKYHIKYIRHNKIPSEYFGQVISYFIVDPEISFVDFVSFCPDLECKPIWIKRIDREEYAESIEEYKQALIKFGEAINQLKQDLTF